MVTPEHGVLSVIKSRGGTHRAYRPGQLSASGDFKRLCLQVQARMAVAKIVPKMEARSYAQHRTRRRRVFSNSAAPIKHVRKIYAKNLLKTLF